MDAIMSTSDRSDAINLAVSDQYQRPFMASPMDIISNLDVLDICPQKNRRR